MSEFMCVFNVVWGCVNMWLKRGSQKGFGSRVKVWSKDESYDDIEIDLIFF